MTIFEAVLSAVNRLEQAGVQPTLARIAVSCWGEDREWFGLAGYEATHPDVRKVACAVMGRRGLVKQGYLSHPPGVEFYYLTDAGRNRICYAQQDLPQVPETTRPTNGRRVASADDAALQRMLGSTAWSKWRLKQRDAIHFTMALEFWGLAADHDIESGLEQVAALLVKAPPAVLSNGRSVEAEDVKQLILLHRFLVDRFARHVRLSSRRKKVQS